MYISMNPYKGEGMTEKKTKQAKFPVTAKESVYSAQELAEAGIMGVRYECIKAALTLKGIKEATMEEAKRIICDFMKTEVN